MAFDELDAEARLADVKCDDCEQPMNFRAYPKSKYPGAEFERKEGDCCFEPHRIGTKKKKKKGKSGGNRRRH